MPDITYLRSLENRLLAAQLLATGTGAWPAIRRLVLDVRATIRDEVREMDQAAEEGMLEEIRQREADYWHEEKAEAEWIAQPFTDPFTGEMH